MADDVETTAQKIARMRAEKLKRQETYAAADEAAQLEGLELEDRFTKELGRLGVAFAMVDATEQQEGFIVVKLGSDLAFRAYVDAVTVGEGSPAAADLYAFVGPCVVHPTLEEYAEIVRRKGFIANRAAEALASLHGTRKKKIDGKF
jgi:hypothetical protein